GWTARGAAHRAQDLDRRDRASAPRRCARWSRLRIGRLTFAARREAHGGARHQKASTGAGALPILSCVMASQTDAEREIEESRESYREWLAGPESFLAAVARHELPLGSALRIGVTRERDGRAERVVWISFEVDDEACRLAVTRLVEPGVPADSYQVFFRDRTSGDETYALGRYLDLEDAEDGRYVVDFNRAYNPA